MRLLYRRPLAAVCFLSVALLAIAVFLPFAVKVILCGGGMLIAVALLIFSCVRRRSGTAKPDAAFEEKSRKIPHGPAFITALTLFACMLCSVLSDDLPGQRYAFLIKEEHVVTARVTSVSGTGSYVTVGMRLTEADGKAAGLRVCSFFYDGFDYEEGDILTFTGTFDALSRRNGDDIYLLADGQRCEVTPVTSPEKVGHRFSLSGSMRRLRNQLSDEIAKIVPERPAGLIRALLLGDKSGLPLSDTVAFRRLGVGHLLALSGLHLSVLLGFVLAFIRRLCPYRSVTAPVACLLVAAYATLTGGSVSILRAAIMSAAALLSWLWGARRDPLTALAVAGAALMLFAPGCAYDCAFWLSFSATLAILVFSPLAARRKKEKGLHRLLTERVLSPVLLTMCASLFTLFPTAVFFGRISTVSVLANLLLAPMVEVCLFLSLFLPLLGAIPVFGSFVGFIIGKWASLTLTAAEWLAQIPNATAFLNHPLIIVLIGCLTVTVCMILFGPKRPMGLLCAVASVFLVTVIAVTTRVNTDAMTAHYVRYHAVKSTDSLLLSDSGDKFLILCGKGSGSSARAQNEMLAEEMVAELDAVVLAHCHEGNARAWLRRLLSGTRVGVVYLPADSSGSEVEQLRALLAPFGTKLQTISSSETYRLSQGTSMLMFPESVDKNGREAFGYTVTAGGMQWTLQSQALAGSPSLASADAAVFDGNVIVASHGYTTSLPVTPLYTRKTKRLVIGRGDMSVAFLPEYPPPPVVTGDDLRFTD